MAVCTSMCTFKNTRAQTVDPISQTMHKICKFVHNKAKFMNKNMSSKATTFLFDDHICWMDLEMTGLDGKNDEIMEISCLITDKNLNILSEGPSFAIHQPKEILDNMDAWCKKTHNESGLVEKCLASQITCDEAENILLDYLEKHLPKGKVPLAGNTIYMDRLFLRLHMPKVDDYLHYRLIDVSTIKELALRWNPAVLKQAPPKVLRHRSLDDIIESIKELQYYREHFFRLADEN